MKTKDTRLRWACYMTNITMSVVGNLSAVLFLTFQGLYDISFTLLGLLVLINFSTQLTVDLIFSFFSHKFNIPKAVRFTPVLGVIGLCVYAVWPWIFPSSAYLGLVIGTVIFSASSGFAEVLISPVIAALPSDNPEREMSKLHSVYAWGVVGVVVISTLFLLVFKKENWQWLALFFSLVPLVAAALFCNTEIPKMETQERVSGVLKFFKRKALWQCIAAIFFGGAAEVVMAQWCSAYLEQAMGIPKEWGDIFGVALFAVALGLGRSLYAKKGKNIERVLLWSGIGATACYLIAALIDIPLVGLGACAFTGFCVAMLWPGSLVVAADKFPTGGVFIYAMMAAGGDMGAAIGPQLVGLTTDLVIASERAMSFALNHGFTPEQFGMKIGMLVGMIFPLLSIFVYWSIVRDKKKNGKLLNGQETVSENA